MQGRCSKDRGAFASKRRLYYATNRSLGPRTRLQERVGEGKESVKDARIPLRDRYCRDSVAKRSYLLPAAEANLFGNTWRRLLFRRRFQETLALICGSLSIPVHSRIAVGEMYRMSKSGG